MNNLLQMPVVDHSMFSYENGVFAAEASDFGKSPFMHRVYNDSLDMGIRVQGKVHQVLFLLDEECRNADGDVTKWVFKPRMVDQLKLNTLDVKLLIFND